MKQKVMVVDDEPDLCEVFADYISSLGYGVDTFTDPFRALQALKTSKDYFVILTDYQMPGMNGIELCNAANKLQPLLPVVCISGYIRDHDDFKKNTGAKFAETVSKPLSGLQTEKLLEIYSRVYKTNQSFQLNLANKQYADVILIGVSTGGLQALKLALTDLGSRNLHLPPILACIHTQSAFLGPTFDSIVKWSGLQRGKIENSEILMPGALYMPDGEFHIGVEETGNLLRLSVDRGEYVNGFRPSIDSLFIKSSGISQHKVTALILTGMGKDGAAGIAKLRLAGFNTIAEHPSTCTVFGMPREAIALDGIEYTGTIDQIRAYFLDVVSKGPSHRIRNTFNL